MKALRSINPFSGELIDTHPADRPKTINTKLDAAVQAQDAWRNTPLNERTALFRALAARTAQKREELARIMVLEMGKPIVQARAEIDKCELLCRVMAEHAEEWLGAEDHSNAEREARVINEPLGVLLGIMPWNYPFWQAFRFFVPAIIAGNACILKHASNVSACAHEIVSLLREVGAPSGLFDAVFLPGADIEPLIADKRIAAVSLTGSEAAGRSVAAIAGANLKPSLLELGGSNAFIVCEDADLEQALEGFMKARFQNNGQSCIAAKRLLLHRGVHDSFVDALAGRMRAMNPSDPMQEDCVLGPLARIDLAEELEQQMLRSIGDGADRLFGGERKDACFHPALLVNVDANCTAFREETFGPLVAVTAFSSLEEAIHLSNSSDFGLGVSVFSVNPEAILKRSSDFKEGAVFVNDLVYSDPYLPFGGIKNSGYGRELGKDGMLSFVNRKTLVSVRRSS